VKNVLNSCLNSLVRPQKYTISGSKSRLSVKANPDISDYKNHKKALKINLRSLCKNLVVSNIFQQHVQTKNMFDQHKIRRPEYNYRNLAKGNEKLSASGMDKHFQPNQK
jgi:hypothetical protein